MTRSRLPFPTVALNDPVRSICVCAFFLLSFATVDAASDQMPAGLWKARSGDLRLQILPKNQIRFFADQNTTAFEVKLDTEATVRREYWFAVDSIKSVEHKVRAPKEPKPKTKSAKPRSPAPQKSKKTEQNTAQKDARKNAGKQAAETGAPQTKPAASANQTNKTQGSTKPPAKQQAAAKAPPANKGPLRLGWLTKDAKIILSFLTEYPPPAPKPQKRNQKKKAKKEPASAKKTASAADPKSTAGDSSKNLKDAPPAKQKQTNAAQKTTQQSAAKAPKPKTPAPRKKQPKKPRGPMPIVELLVFQNGQLVHEAIFERGR